MSEIKKNPVGRPAVNAVPVTLRLPPDLLAALDKFAAEAKGNRPTSIRLILRDWLVGHRYLDNSEN